MPEDAGYAIFDVKIDALEKCCDSDVIEAIQENFYGNLKDKQIEKMYPMEICPLLQSREKLRNRKSTGLQ